VSAAITAARGERGEDQHGQYERGGKR